MPRTTAPASRSRETMNASRAGAARPTSASDPAVVIIRSAVSMLSLMSTGTPCSGPAHAPLLALAVALGRNRQRVGVHLDHRVERRAAPVHVLDAREVALGERDSRQVASGTPSLQFVHGDLVEIEGA